ncbi:MAG: formimidoylglutamase, partial [Steroidobacteraceae bacterium]
DGPGALRRQLANLPLPVESAGPLYDAGDIVCVDDALEAAQGELAALVAALLGQDLFPVVLGGGHETAWGCYQGLAAALAGTDALAGLGIVNFDAHFDLRELPAPGRGTSGTPFRQIALARRAQSLPFHYLCIGASPASNTSALFTAARELGVTTIADSELIWPNWLRVLTTLDAFLERCTALYLTVCLDAFPAAVAPGVSAPAARGIPVDFAFAMLEHLVARSRLRNGGRKLVLMDVVELNPRYDRDDATARLAARIVHDVVRPLLGPAG